MARLIIIAGIFEIGFAVLLKESHGITRSWPTIGFAACALISFGLLSEGIKRPLKLASIALILVGVIGLNLSGITP
jgi:quaternary ammonium compound-resistance protein SugE